MNSVIAKSQKNLNTQGSKFEEDLKDIRTNCSDLDHMFVQYEHDFMTNGTLSKTEMGEIDDACTKMTALMKVATKKQAALESWFKVI